MTPTNFSGSSPTFHRVLGKRHPPRNPRDRLGAAEAGGRERRRLAHVLDTGAPRLASAVDARVSREGAKLGVGVVLGAATADVVTPLSALLVTVLAKVLGPAVVAALQIEGVGSRSKRGGHCKDG